MHNNFHDLERKMRQICEMMSDEQNAERMLALASELEGIFEQKDLLSKSNAASLKTALHR